MIVVDASVWVSVLLQQDANHSQSRAWARVWSQRLRTFAVPTLFLAELSGVLQRRGGTSEFASRQIDTILTSPTFTVHELTLDLGREAATIAFTMPCEARTLSILPRQSGSGYRSSRGIRNS